MKGLWRVINDTESWHTIVLKKTTAWKLLVKNLAQNHFNFTEPYDVIYVWNALTERNSNMQFLDVSGAPNLFPYFLKIIKYFTYFLYFQSHNSLTVYPIILLTAFLESSVNLLQENVYFYAFRCSLWKLWAFKWKDAEFYLAKICNAILAQFKTHGQMSLWLRWQHLLFNVSDISILFDTYMTLMCW